MMDRWTDEALKDFYNSVASFLNLWTWSDLFIGKFYFLLLSPPNLNPSVSDIVSKFLESYKELPSGVVNSLGVLWTK